MKQANRLRRHAEYQKLYQRSRKQHSKHISYFFSPRPGDAAESSSRLLNPLPKGPQIGLTVGRVMGNAVIRNRIKRRLRAAVTQHLPLLQDACIDVALHPKRGFQDLPWESVQQDVATIFRAIARRLAAQTDRTHA